uniref:Uncharacterized protein n=1 Tax=Salix viminalis TaxID=40686 RepID=A0A6N2LD82_SALVM
MDSKVKLKSKAICFKFTKEDSNVIQVTRKAAETFVFEAFELKNAIQIKSCIYITHLISPVSCWVFAKKGYYTFNRHCRILRALFCCRFQKKYLLWLCIQHVPVITS